jgi:toxin-antitoxin system PIN domain toxin
MLIDANLLLFAIHRKSALHAAARDWLTAQLNGSRRVGLPWQSLASFLRIATHPRAFERPLEPAVAWERVTDWLSCSVAWIPQPGRDHARILGELIVRYEVRGNLLPDAHLAALAIEHGVAVFSADTDFARFTEVRWENPLVSPP